MGWGKVLIFIALYSVGVTLSHPDTILTLDFQIVII